jgi:hypothetical protein
MLFSVTRCGSRRRTQLHIWLRQYTSANAEIPQLPAHAEWGNVFGGQGNKLTPTRGIKVAHRISLSNAETAKKVAEAMIPDGSKDKIIIEGFPGENLTAAYVCYVLTRKPSRPWSAYQSAYSPSERSD